MTMRMSKVMRMMATPQFPERPWNQFMMLVRSLLMGVNQP